MECNWNDPGQDPYQLQPATALASYRLPGSVHEELRKKMETLSFDDVVVITKDSIKGAFEYSNLRDMHFGKGRVCKSPDRSQWKSRTEVGLVYCSGDVCVLVPTVCRNVSRIDRKSGIRNVDNQNASEELAGGGSSGRGSVISSGITWAQQSRPDVVAWGEDPRFKLNPLIPYQSQTFFQLSLPPASVGFIGYVRVLVVPAVPEIETWLMFGLGLGILALGAKTQKK